MSLHTTIMRNRIVRYSTAVSGFFRMENRQHEKMIAREPPARSAREKKRVGALAAAPWSRSPIFEHWLARVKRTKEVSRLSLNDEDRTRHLRKPLEDMVLRLSKPSTTTKDSDAVSSNTGIAHGKLRFIPGYSPQCWCTSHEYFR
jgi:hypothetical protein